MTSLHVHVPCDHSPPDFEVLVSPDASHAQWDGFLSQISGSEHHSDDPVENMTHRFLAFFSGTFTGAQICRGTVDNEVSAVVSSVRPVDYLV